MRLRQKHSVMFLMLTESLNTISSVKMNYTSTVCVNRSRAKLHNSLLSCFVMMLTAEYFNYTSITAQSVHMIPKLHLFSKQRGQQCQSVSQNCFINSFTLQAASIEHCGKNVSFAGNGLERSAVFCESLKQTVMLQDDQPATPDRCDHISRCDHITRFD